MGKVKDLLISGSSSEELREMVDTARDQHNEGYTQFLEEQLEKAEKKILKYKVLLQAKMGPGYCVECFEYLPKDEIICGKCQDECDGRWDDIRE
jgi:hypothetical protein